MRHAGAEFGCGWVPAVEEGWGDMPEGVGVQGDTSVRNCVVWPETHGREAGGASSGRGMQGAGGSTVTSAALGRSFWGDHQQAPQPCSTAGPVTSPDTFLGNEQPNTSVPSSTEQRGAIQSSGGE